RASARHAWLGLRSRRSQFATLIATCTTRATVVHRLRCGPFRAPEPMTNRYPADRWRSHLLPALLPRGMDGWLRDPGSLTARITARCDRFAVRVLRQRLGKVLDDEVALLGLPHGDWAWVREVLLLADGMPVVYARSVMPRANVGAGS